MLVSLNLHPDAGWCNPALDLIKRAAFGTYKSENRQNDHVKSKDSLLPHVRQLYNNPISPSMLSFFQCLVEYKAQFSLPLCIHPPSKSKGQQVIMSAISSSSRMQPG
jgi:hypothetical protein